jgi:hypothetical protein
MRVFISYSRTDSAFVTGLSRDLGAAGHDVWLDREDIHGGEAWRRSIGEGIAGAGVVLVVLTPASVGSPNVERELTVADEAGKPLLPVLAEATPIPPGLSYVLAGVQRVDFTDRPYRQAFDDLLAALPDAERQATKGSASGKAATGEAGAGGATAGVGTIAPARVRRARGSTGYRERGPTRLQLGIALGVVVAIAAFLSGMLIAMRHNDPLAIGQFVGSPNCNRIALVTGQVPKQDGAKQVVRNRLSDTNAALAQIGVQSKAAYLDGDKSCFSQPDAWLVTAGMFTDSQQARQVCAALRGAGEFANDPSIPLSLRTTRQSVSCG